jgi:hypothetical protein
MTSVNAAVRRLVLRLVHACTAPADRESDLARELAAHLALLEDDFRRRGLSAEDARTGRTPGQLVASNR